MSSVYEQELDKSSDIEQSHPSATANKAIQNDNINTGLLLKSHDATLMKRWLSCQYSKNYDIWTLGGMQTNNQRTTNQQNVPRFQSSNNRVTNSAQQVINKRPTPVKQIKQNHFSNKTSMFNLVHCDFNYFIRHPVLDIRPPVYPSQSKTI